MDYSNITWKSMLTRFYNPIFASAFGIYASRFYDKFMVVYNQGWCYWYVPKEYYEHSHDSNFCTRFDWKSYEKRSSDTLEIYGAVYDKITQILELWKELRKNNSSTKSNLVKILGDPYNSVVNSNITPQEIQNLDTFFDNFGILLSYPEMTIGPYINVNIMERLSEIMYGKKTTELEETQLLTIDEFIPILTYNDNEGKSISTEYELELNILSLHIKNKLIKDAIMEVKDTFDEPKGGAKRDYYLRIEKHIKRRLQRIPEIISKKLGEYLKNSEEVNNFISRYSPMRSGWSFGKGLSIEEVQHRLKSIIKFDDISIEELLKIEIEYAKLNKFHESMEISKKTLIERLRNKTDGKRLGEFLLYANILSHDGWMRYNRKNFASMVNYYSADIMKDISSFLNLNSWNDISFLTITEIVQQLKGNDEFLDYRELERRKKNMLMIFDEGKIQILRSGNDVKNYLDNVQIDGDNPYDDVGPQKSSIEGKAVNYWKGEIKGKVVMIDNEQDLLEVSGNDIVVAKMIEPYQGMVFRQPKGMIIEDPSMTSHAVYVARSRGIPLIVDAKGILLFIRKKRLVGEDKLPHLGLEMQPDGEINVGELWG